MMAFVDIPTVQKIKPGIILIASLLQAAGLVKPHYKKAIILSSGRSGSTLLQEGLALNPKLRVYTEIFSNWYLKRQTRYLKFILQNYPLNFLNLYVYRYYRRSVQAVAFKILYDQCQEETNKQVWDYLSRSADIKILHIKRNLLDVYVSYQLAIKYATWHVRQENQLEYTKTASVWIDPQDCYNYLKRVASQRNAFDDLFKQHDCLEVWYESINTNIQAELDRIQRWLGVTPVKVQPKTFKQFNRPLAEIIENYSNLKEFFHGSDWEGYFNPRTQ